MRKKRIYRGGAAIVSLLIGSLLIFGACRTSGGDSKTQLSAGAAVSAGASATSATVEFTGAEGLTLAAADFTVTGGAEVDSVTVDGGTAKVTISFEANTGTENKTYTVGISSASAKIKGTGTVIVTQGFPGDGSKTTLTAGSAVNVAATATGASVTFSGASGLTLTKDDFTVSAGAATIGTVSVSSNIATVPITFAANDTDAPKTYTVGINSASTLIKGTAEVTVTQAADSGERAITWLVDPPAAGNPEDVFTTDEDEAVATIVAKGAEYKFKVVDVDSYYLHSVKAGEETLTATDGVYSYTVNADVTITATFSVNPLYTVTVNSAGTGHSGGGLYLKDSEVNVFAGAAPKGMEFKGWTATGIDLDDLTEGTAADANITFNMPAQAVSLTAAFGYIDYTITLDFGEYEDRIDEFTVSAWYEDNGVPTERSAGTAQFEDEIRVSVVADRTGAFYIVKSLTVALDDPDDDPAFNGIARNTGVFNFIMPAGDITVTVAEVGELADDEGAVELAVLLDADFAGLHSNQSLSRRTNDSAEYALEHAAEYESVTWYVDGEKIDDAAKLSGDDLIVNAADWSIGRHTVSVVVEIEVGSNIQQYSRTVHFTVTR